MVTSKITFEVEADPRHERILELSTLEPANPFYTPEYAALRRRLDELPVLLVLREGTRIVAGCTAFVKTGRMQKSLEIPSRLAVPDSLGSQATQLVWRGIAEFCRSAGITAAAITTFASRQGPTIPSLGNETMRKRRWEFVVELQAGENLPGMRKGHAYCVRQARRAGILLSRTRNVQACAKHVELMNSSMDRRRELGEDVGSVEMTDAMVALLEANAAELFQAVRGDEVLSSSMLLLAPAGAYNHTSGTSPVGRECGAAHFVINEAAASLWQEGRRTFNLGGTDQADGGLAKFKSGFGTAVSTIELDAANFQLRGPIAAAWLAATRRLRHAS